MSLINSLVHYASQLPKALSHPKPIIEGLINEIKMEEGILKDEEVEEIVKRRLICNDCEELKSNSSTKWCGLCGCNIKLKTACLGCQCGAFDYNKKHPLSPKPIKWTEYESAERNPQPPEGDK